MTKSLIATLGLAFAFTAHVQGAVTLKYWDINGATAGAGGATPSGTWDTTTANWNTSSAGTSAATTYVSGSGNTAVFSAGTDATGDYTITLGRNLSIYDLTVQEGNPTFNRSGSYGISVYDGKLTVNGSCIATFNIPWTGSGSIDKWGTGTAVYNGTSTMVNYPWTLNEGTIAVGNDAAFGAGAYGLTIGDTTGAKVVTLKSADSTAHTIPNHPLVFNAANFTLDAGGDLTFSGATSVGSSAYVPTSITVKNNSTFSGVWSGTAGISLNAASTGTLTFSGSSANTYGSATANGKTTVNAGTLKLMKTAGVNAIANGTIVLTGGTLQLAAANQIADAVAMQLNGGTFNPAGNSETLGTLSLTADSIISLGGTEAISFADSHGVSWTAATTVTISGWSGSLAGGGANTITFGTTSAGLTADQVTQMRFLDPAGVVAGTYNAKILGTGEVVPDSGLVAPALSYDAAAGLELKIAIAPVLDAWTKPAGHTLSLLSVASPTSGGGTVSADSTRIYYTPPAGSPADDTIVYTVRDETSGATGEGTITITFIKQGGQAQSISPVNGVVTLSFAGIPGYAYDVQRSAAVDFNPYTTVLTTNAPSLGLFIYTDTDPLPGSGFYRLMQH